MNYTGKQHMTLNQPSLPGTLVSETAFKELEKKRT